MIILSPMADCHAVDYSVVANGRTRSAWAKLLAEGPFVGSCHAVALAHVGAQPACFSDSCDKWP
jgi:hypothetical protein